MIWHVQNENFILDSTRIFMKAFHLLLFNGSFIFPECILIFGLILLLMIDSTSDQKDRPWFYFISSTSLVISITALLFRWREEPIISFSGNFQTNNFNEIFQFLILLCSTLCIPLSVEYLEILLGVGDSIKRDSEATISPLPSIGLARAFITRPKLYTLTGIWAILPVAFTKLPSWC